jgi:hypothetical protein
MAASHATRLSSPLQDSLLEDVCRIYATNLCSGTLAAPVIAYLVSARAVSSPRSAERSEERHCAPGMGAEQEVKVLSGP